MRLTGKTAGYAAAGVGWAMLTLGLGLDQAGLRAGAPLATIGGWVIATGLAVAVIAATERGFGALDRFFGEILSRTRRPAPRVEPTFDAFPDAPRAPALAPPGRRAEAPARLPPDARPAPAPPRSVAAYAAQDGDDEPSLPLAAPAAGRAPLAPPRARRPPPAPERREPSTPKRQPGAYPLDAPQPARPPAPAPAAARSFDDLLDRAGQEPRPAVGEPSPPAARPAFHPAPAAPANLDLPRPRPEAGRPSIIEEGEIAGHGYRVLADLTVEIDTLLGARVFDSMDAARRFVGAPERPARARSVA